MGYSMSKFPLRACMVPGSAKRFNNVYSTSDNMVKSVLDNTPTALAEPKPQKLMTHGRCTTMRCGKYVPLFDKHPQNSTSSGTTQRHTSK